VRPRPRRFVLFTLFLSAIIAGPRPSAGEKEAPLFLERARALQRDDGARLLDIVKEDRGTAFASTDLLLNGKDADAASLSEGLAAAYAQAFGDRALVERVALFRRWTTSQRATRDQAVKLKREGIEAYGKGSASGAIVKFKQASTLLKQSGDVLEEGRCLANLSSMAAVQRDAKSAAAWASAARATIPRSGDLGLLISLEISRAFVLEDGGDLPQAKGALQSALKAARDWNDREGEAAVLVNLGDIAQGLGELDEALRLARETAAVGRAIGNAEIEATALNNQAALHSKRGDLDEALASIRKAVTLAHEAGLSRLEADFESNQAHILMKQGRYEEALEHIALARKAAASLDLPTILASIDLEEAQAHQEQGRYREALVLLDAAQARLRGLDASDLLGTIHEVRAIADYYLGRFSEAVGELHAAMREYRAGGRVGQGATAHRNLGLLQFFLGETSSAIAQLETAARMHQQSGSPYDRAMDLDALGVVRQRSGDLAGARRTLEAALAALPADHALGRGDLRVDLAAVELASGAGRREAGLDLLRRAGALFAQEKDAIGLEQTATLLADAALEAGDIATARGALENARTLCGDRRPAELEWKMLYLEGRVLEAARQEREAGQRYAESVSEVERLRGDLAAAEWRAAILEDRIAPYRSLSRWYRARGDVEEAYRVARMAKARTFVERLSLPSFSVDSPAEEVPRRLLPALGVSLSAIQANLEPGELLLDFFFDDGGLVAFQVERAGLSATVIAERDPSASLAGTLEILRSPGRPASTPKTVEQSWRAAARLAGSRLFEPLLASMKSARKLLISPNGPLHGIPFAALEVEGRPLVARWSFSLLPAAESLLERRAPRPAASVAALILGDPAGRDGESLPGSADEARGVADRIGPSASLFLGRAAMETVFREQAPHQAWIHVAAHGRVNALSPLHSYIQLAPGRGQDGRLEAAEIAAMSFPGSLIVLSGCETGVEGGLSRGSAEGDERAGLPRAFLSAGAASVIASLWDVDDLEAQAYIPELYPLLEGRSPAEALGELQRNLLSGKLRGRDGKPLSHPYYWAGLTDYGPR
jgi:tetratricopeptide (TPR) repeat protein